MPSAWLRCRNYAGGRRRRLQEGALCYLWLCLLQVRERGHLSSTECFRDCLQGAHIGECLLACGASGEGPEHPRYKASFYWAQYPSLQLGATRPEGFRSQMDGC